jgi:hypothetical protein
MSRIAPTFPSTQNTQNSINVTTSAGFNQGDLVYYSNGDYKSPANLPAPSSISFSANQPQLILGGGYGGFSSSVFSNSDLRTANAYGSSSAQSMAVLTNGNIVQVFKSYTNNYPSFRIINSSGAIVVSATAISTSSTYQQANNVVAVTALTGGGFAVMFYDSSSNPSYAVYTNSGTVTTAVTSDAISGTTLNAPTSIRMTSLANGGFAAITQAANNNLYAKIYTSSGGTTAAWFSLWSGGGQGTSFGIASRSDNSIAVMGYNSSTSLTTYAVYSSTGTSIVSATSVGAGSGSYPYLSDVICLADGSTFAFIFVNGSGGVVVSFLPTGNTLSGVTTLIPVANFISSGLYMIRGFAMASGGFAIFISDGVFALNVAFYNSTGSVSYTGSNSSGNLPLTFPQFVNNYYSVASFPTWETVYENGGNIYFAYANTGSSQFNYTYVSFNETTYTVNVPSTTQYTSLASPTVSGSGTPSSISLPGTSPNKVSYYSSSNIIGSGKQAVSIKQAQTTITSNSVIGICTTTLTDGRVAVGYTYYGGNVYVQILSPSGGVITTLNVGPSGYSLFQAGISLFSLSNGKLGVAYTYNSASIAISIYSSSYSLLASSTAVTLSQAPTVSYLYNDTYGPSVTGNPYNDHIAILYGTNTGYLYAQILDSSLNAVTSFQLPSSSNSSSGSQVIPTANNGFFLRWDYSNYAYNAQFIQTGATTYTQFGSTYSTYNSGNNTYKNNFKAFYSNSNGGVWAPYGYSSTSYLGINYLNMQGSTLGYFTTQTPYTSSNIYGYYGYSGFGSTGNGCPVYVSSSTSSSQTATFTISGGSGGASMQYNYPGTSTITTSATYSIYVYPQFSITAGPGDTAFIFWSNTSGYLNYMIVTITPAYVPYAALANTTPSSGVAILPGPSGTGIVNTSFIGVSNGTASAGGSASVTTNGSAVLNSNYSSSTPFQSFDHQMPNGGSGIQGTKGTMVGRNVNMTGNN